MIVNPRIKDWIIVLFAAIALASLYENIRLTVRCGSVNYIKAQPILRPGPPVGNRACMGYDKDGNPTEVVPCLGPPVGNPAPVPPPRPTASIPPPQSWCTKVGVMTIDGDWFCGEGKRWVALPLPVPPPRYKADADFFWSDPR